MPSVTLSTSQPTTARADVLILGIRGDDDKGELAETLDVLGFTGEKGQTSRFPSGGLVKAPVVIAIALPDEPTAEDLRRAAAKGVRLAKNAASVAIALHPAGVDEVEAIAEGVTLGAYTYTAFKTTKKDAKKPVELTSAVILTPFAR
ncbi:MAG: M17 family peptidase N-terminal domain-containing protein, partial [Aeromicrobium sp.]